jgi:hypothetical protein
VITFIATRTITLAIRGGRGPFKNTTVGGVHVHHQVYGIFLLLTTGTAEFAYRPDSPWLEILAVLFGTGAALTLDEFALWVRLDDVYWGPEGRQSVDAVLVAIVIGTFLLLGVNPFADDAAAGRAAAAVTVTVNLGFAMVAILKGRVVWGLIGMFLPVVAVVFALRLARPNSPWARRWYRPGSRRLRRAHERFPTGAPGRWAPLVNMFAGRPTAARGSDREG